MNGPDHFLTKSQQTSDQWVRQRTLKSSIDCTGVALHSGNKVRMVMHPANPNSGIIFRRTDIGDSPIEIPALWNRVVDTRLCSVIGNEDGISVSTVEHVMAALSGCGIDNIIIDVNGSEAPIMDGSSEPFVFLIECAGVLEQDAPRRIVRVLKPVVVHDGDSMVSLTPSDRFMIDIEIDFDSGAVDQKNFCLGVVNGAFSRELARARTFGFLHDVEAMRAAGFAKGGSLDNAIVISGDKIMNEGGLRFNDEFVRHKALDAVGDMYLAGGQIIGAFNGIKSGHALNNRLLRSLFADSSAWTFDTVMETDADRIPNGGINLNFNEKTAVVNA